MATTETRGYEDAYVGIEYDSLDELLCTASQMWLDDLFGKWNVPVWIHFDEDEQRVKVGVMLTRHGYTAIHIAPCSPERLCEVQRLVMEVWAGRADTGFARYRCNDLVPA